MRYRVLEAMFELLGSNHPMIEDKPVPVESRQLMMVEIFVPVEVLELVEALEAEGM